METLRAYFAQFTDLWRDASVPMRWAYGVCGVTLLLAVAGVAWWSTQDDWVSLGNQLSSTQAAELMDKLDSANIPNNLSQSGRSVLVPRNQWNHAIVAAGPLVGSDLALTEQSTASPLLPTTIIQDNMRIKLENELARTILGLEGISTARVHIATGKPSPFEKQRVDSTASVFLTTSPSRILTQTLAHTVSDLVSGSVPGMDSKNVTVVSSDGRTFRGGIEDAMYGFDRDLQKTQSYESNLRSKAEAVLRDVGVVKAKVMVTADIAYRKTETKEEAPSSPTAKLVIESEIKDSQTTEAAGGTSGVAGATANLNPRIRTRANDVIKKDSTEITKYEHPKRISTNAEHIRDIKRLSISAAVTVPEPPDGQTAITNEEITKLIKGAVGFDEKRGDQLSVQVVNAPVDPAQEAAAFFTQENWDSALEVVRSGSLGLASVVAFVLGFLVLRRLRPITISDPRTGELPPDEQANQIVKQIQENPDAVASILSSWMDSDAAETGEAPPTRRAA